MKTLTFAEITAGGPALLQQLHAAGQVIILHEGMPLAFLSPMTPPAFTPRPLGCYAGQIKLADDFNDPLPV